MSDSILRSRTPLEKEIKEKKVDIARLESDLVEAELDFATFENELLYFEVFYNARVGVYLVELDELNARLAESIAILSPRSDGVQENAQAAREQAERTFNEASGFSSIQDDQQKPKSFSPPENIKKMYRELAKKVHPDLAKNEEDKKRRNLYMQEVNRAYSEQDLVRLQEILQEWEEEAESFSSTPLESELNRLNRIIKTIEHKIMEIYQKKNLLDQTELGQLKRQYDTSADQGVDVLSKIILEIQSQINKKNKKILKAIKIMREQDLVTGGK